MKQQMITNSRINEQYIHLKHESGLDIMLYPMAGYSSIYALFATKYGSIDRVFKTEQDKDFVTVPDGIAHFLEHKMFEQENGTDAFELYAETGASANAYTSFDRTAYLFSCSDNFERSLEILLNFVQSPYFTEETVQKEQGIIGQEIRMYDDNPGWRVYFNMLGCLYHNHPVKTDIAGTVESISEIDAELLYRCYHTFYNPSNMVLAISGNFDVKTATEIINKHIISDKPVEIERGTYDEPDSVAKKREEISFEVSQPLFCIGYKLEPRDGIQRLRAELQCELLNEILVGEGSRLYRNLYDSGLISGGNISSQVMNGNGYFCNIVDGESRDPDQVYKLIQEEITKLKQEGIQQDLFEVSKKTVYGRILRYFDNVEAVATGLVNAHFADTDIYDRIDLAAALNYDEIAEMLNEYNNDKSAISIVSPLIN